MRSIVRSIAEIEHLLLRNLTPITDNQDALIELGFVRAYPHRTRGYESMIWERSVERRPRPYGRVLVRERAFLEPERPRT